MDKLFFLVRFVQKVFIKPSAQSTIPERPERTEFLSNNNVTINILNFFSTNNCKCKKSYERPGIYSLLSIFLT